jgi:transposase-like protein
MPWKERSVVEERMRFVLRLKDGESMASLCREFGISRVTATLGRSQASRTAASQVAQRCSRAGLQHHPRHHGPPWAGG